MATEQNSSPADDAKLKAYVEIWTKAVDTQMHFNEMSAKSRQLGLTFVVAALGLGIVLLGRREDFGLSFSMCGSTYTLHMAGLIFLAAAFAVWGVSILDLHVYHKMLRGAVTFGEDLEENYLKKIVDLDKGMTQAISHYSRFSDASFTRESGRYKYQGGQLVPASQKIGRFYTTVIIALLVMAVAIFATTYRVTPKTNQESTVKVSDGK